MKKNDQTQAKGQAHHIRPKLRTPNNRRSNSNSNSNEEKQEEDLDVMLHRIRQRILMKEEGKSKSSISINGSARGQVTKQPQQQSDTQNNSKNNEMSNMNVPIAPAAVRKGILKNKVVQKSKNNTNDRVYQEESTVPSASLPIDENNRNPAVKNFVVERALNKNPESKQDDSVMNTTTTRTGTVGGEGSPSFFSWENPTINSNSNIQRSVADLKDAQVFAASQVEGYDIKNLADVITQKTTKATATAATAKKKDSIDVQKKSRSTSKKEYFSDTMDTEDDTIMNDDELSEKTESTMEEEGSSMYDFLMDDSTDSEEGDDPRQTPAPEPNSFIKIWESLTGWITPQTTTVVNEFYSRSSSSLLIVNNSSQNSIDSLDMESLSLVDPLVDQTDIGASRYTGLMSIIKMYLKKSLEEWKNFISVLDKFSSSSSNAHSGGIICKDGLVLFQRKCLHWNNNNEQQDQGHKLRLVEYRISRLLRTFNFSRSTPNLDTKLWKAFTFCLISIVLGNGCFIPTEDTYNNNNMIEEDMDRRSKTLLITIIGEENIPNSLKSTGILWEQYLYLVNSSILTLAKGSA